MKKEFMEFKKKYGYVDNDWDKYNKNGRFAIDELKKEGHELLQVYIHLDPIKSKRKVSVARAYSKLSQHFSELNTTGELLKTIKKLKKMIQLRIEKNNEKSREQYAPNLRELQKRKWK